MQAFRACHLCTFNVAAIFFRGHPYIWRTTVRHDICTSMHLWSVESLLADIKKMASDDLYNCKLFTVEKDGKSLKLKERQLTTSVLARVFCLFPETIILVSDDGYVEILDEDGCFNSVDDLPVWTVTGDSMNPTSAAPPTAMMTPFAYQPPRAAGRKTRARKWAPIYRTSLFQHQKPPGVRAQESSDYTSALHPGQGRFSHLRLNRPPGASTLKFASGANGRNSGKKFLTFR